jgi:hypothetical protein
MGKTNIFGTDGITNNILHRRFEIQFDRTLIDFNFIIGQLSGFGISFSDGA